MTRPLFPKSSIRQCIVALLVLACLNAASCSSTRKCNGKKGVKTPMGLM